MSEQEQGVRYEPLSQANVPLDQQDPIQRALNDTKEDRKQLELLLVPLFKAAWTDTLNLLFELFPHEPGDKSENHRIFTAAKARVLRVGNNQVRQLPNVLGDFFTVRVRKTETRTVQVRQDVKLPAGVRRFESR